MAALVMPAAFVAGELKSGPAPLLLLWPSEHAAPTMEHPSIAVHGALPPNTLLSSAPAAAAAAHRLPPATAEPCQC